MATKKARYTCFPDLADKTLNQASAIRIVPRIVEKIATQVDFLNNNRAVIPKSAISKTSRPTQAISQWLKIDLGGRRYPRRMVHGIKKTQAAP
jgi:hypothetical protein